jgi:hypothetical protein
MSVNEWIALTDPNVDPNGRAHMQRVRHLAGVNYLVRPATTIVAGGGGERFR